MTDLSGITVTPGVLDPHRKEALGVALDRVGGKLIDSVRIDTTHFVCTEGRGPLWEKAVEMNIPVVVPEWVDACESEGTIVGVRGYYLNADPKLRQLGTLHGNSHQRTTSTMSNATLAHRPSTTQQPTLAPTPEPENVPEHDSSTIEEPPLTPFPGGETSAPPQALTQEVGSEDEDDLPPPPPPPKDESEEEEESVQPNGQLSEAALEKELETDLGGKDVESDESDRRESTLPQNMPDEDDEVNKTSPKGKGKEGEGDFNEVPL